MVIIKINKSIIIIMIIKITRTIWNKWIKKVMIYKKNKANKINRKNKYKMLKKNNKSKMIWEKNK